MKVLTIGRFLGVNSDNADFGSTISFFDYDIVVIDCSIIQHEYTANYSNSTYRGLKSISDNDSPLIVSDIERRKQEILDLLRLGRTVFVYTPVAQKVYVDSGKREYSGTGKNTRTTRIVNELDILKFLPCSINTITAEGSGIEPLRSPFFDDFWKKHMNELVYSAYFTSECGNPIAKIRGTDKVIASHISIENGNLVFIPNFINDDDDEDLEAGFIDSLKEIATKLKENSGDYTLPSWSQNYILPGEEECKSEILSLEADLEAVKHKISKQKEKLLTLEEYKLLFTGTGRSLEVQVAKVFKELGFEVSEGIPGRDDLILSYNGKVAVVEIKGVTKSAAEKHAAQLEKWVSEYLASKEVAPKGILIVNAFKDVPLTDRSEAAFPAQMLKYCESREHCLLTGTQLLNLYIHIKFHPEAKTTIIESIFNTKGLFTNEAGDYVTFAAPSEQEFVKQ
ncbi:MULTISPECIES: hypothetical protein [Paenibacillus]|uniref:Uncharacterized protein n=1 Tax=Paenibacillus albilobatus TaxID=2716884 RepID=A0A920CBQ7_9BACL|nr:MULTISPECIES: hypothetical protein [Paenibacillus]GIO30762.1 hypothetical protein J2TS6_19030 [Paenibacillus albilobatus]